MALTYQQMSSLLTQNWVAISNKKKQLEIVAAGVIRRIGTLLSNSMTAEGKIKPRTQLSLHGILFPSVCKSSQKLQSVNFQLLMSKGDGDRKITFGLCNFDTDGGTQRVT